MVRAAAPVIALVLLCGAMLVAPPTRASTAAGPQQWASAAQMERLLEQEYRDRHLPGLAATILVNGEVYLDVGFGVAARGGPAITGDTPFVLGSTSKQLTGLLVQQLVADGRLTLDTPVRTVLPELDRPDGRWSGLTIGHLLGHRSGLTEADGLQRWRLGSDPVSIQADLPRIAAITPASPPGERFEYSNANYDVLGAVVERLTGESFESALRARVVEPLGLTATTSDLDRARRDGLATGHYTWLGRWNSAVPAPHPPSAAPSAFISSSAHDLTRLVQAHLGAAPDVPTGMDASVLRAAREPVGAVTDEMSYASGWYVRPLWELTDGNRGRQQGRDLPMLLEHKGAIPRSQSIVAMAPELGLGVVLLGNAGPGTDPGQQRWLLDAVLHELVGTVPEEPSTPALVAAAPVMMVAVPLVQLAAAAWLVSARRSGRRRTVPAVVVGVLTAVALVLGLWVVPDQVGAGLLSSWWWVTAPDLAVAVALLLGLATLSIALLAWVVLLWPRDRIGRPSRSGIV